jgi:hypothetical protein
MKKFQKGATAVEFALVSIIFLSMLLAIMDFGRVLYTWNAAAEATRLGARISVVCDRGATKVLSAMEQFVPMTSSNLHIDWYDATGNISTSCDSSSCAGVAVGLTGLTVQTVSPLAWIGFSSLPVPDFQTYLPREVMGQDPDSNTVCN